MERRAARTGFWLVLTGLLDAVELVRAFQVVDVEDAIEVVYFVLQSLSQESLGLDAHLFALEVLPFDRHRYRTAQLSPVAREAEAPLVYLSLSRALDDLGIYQDPEVLFRNFDYYNS